MRGSRLTEEKHEFSEYIDLDDALSLIFSEVDMVGKEKVSFDKASGRVLARDVNSEVNVPPFDRAAMDGFAVRASDTFGAKENNPNKLEVIGSVEIGGKSEIEVGEDEAVEISTGAPIPKNSDAVIKVEETYRGDNSTIRIIAPVSPGKNVSSKGEDVEVGEKLFETGRLLRPSDIGILASTENLQVEVRKKPKIGISATGDEIREPGEELDTGEITDTNTYTLESAIKGVGGLPKRLESVPDKYEHIERILDLSEKLDLLILTGGTSVGKKDIIPDVIADNGELVFHGVAMRPGGPVGFGIVNETPVFSLPGFPAATLISFEMIVKPTLRKILGLDVGNFRTKVRAELDRKIKSSLGRLDVVRTELVRKKGKYYADPIRVTGSSLLTSISRANGLITIPENKEVYHKGEEVPVITLQDI